MELLDKITEETIIVCNYNNKKNILKEINKYNRLFPITFITLDELYNSIFFHYDKKTIYYLINKYNIKYDVAEVYLKNIIYVNEHTSNNKINKLNDIKKDLIKNNLLINDEYFEEFIKNKKIVFYGFDYIDKFMNKVIDSLCNSEIILKPNNNYSHEVIEFSHIEEEVEYVASSICKLINNKVPIDNIKITNINEEYYNSIKRIFNMYNLSINLDNTCYISSTIIGQEFIKQYEKDLTKTIENMQKYQGDILNQIISIINKYTFEEDKLKVKDMIIHDLNTTKVIRNKLDNAIEIIDYNDIIDDDKYVFMLNFNQGIIPRIIKDEDFFNDQDKSLLDLSLSTDLSKMIKESTIKNIKSIKNLIITYKLESYTNGYYPSNLIEEMQLKVTHQSIDMIYSNLANKVRLCKDLDKYYKYNIKNDKLSTLYHTYKIPYRTYQNSFTGISTESLKKVMNKLVLSYTSMQAYNECSFKYYINNILKLDPYEDTFSAFIGSLFHHILEIGINKEINIQEEINKYLSTKTLNAKELFFVNKLQADIKLVLNTIKDNLKYTKLTNIKTENKFEIVIDDVIFKGFIDKLMSYNDGINTYLAIVDYKTYDTDINLDLIDYGLNLQLPIYLYLVSKKYNNPIYTGFYVQRVLTNDIKYDETKTLEETKINDMKLLGYSNANEKILNLFDNNYEESKVIKGMKTKQDGNFASTANVLTDEEINELIIKTNQEVIKCINNIKSASFSINPKSYNETNISCKYCKYNDLCFKKPSDEIILKVGDNNA